jgi:hypothetical protein
MLLGAVFAISACTELKLPTEKEMTAVFTTDETERLIEPPPPDTIPTIALSEMQDWQELCDKCHVGPHYSSYTILEWGHLDSCLSGMSCTRCHSTELHKTHIRGDKGMCYDCHLDEGISVDCNTCHVEGCMAMHANHGPEFIAEHGQFDQWDGIDCMACHGSQSWCMDCHGIDMPHPENIIDIHQDLVQGRPDVCHNCHGSQSCTRCHLAFDVDLTVPIEE